jgi:hypothetical protein
VRGYPPFFFLLNMAVFVKRKKPGPGSVLTGVDLHRKMLAR